jgi:hypothetical protein
MDKINAFFLVIACILALTIFGCSGTDSSTRPHSSRPEALQTPASLELPPEPRPSEPEYEEIDWYELLQPFQVSKCYERELESCGMSFYKCNDSKVYRCLNNNVVYKVHIERRRVE